MQGFDWVLARLAESSSTDETLDNYGDSKPKTSVVLWNKSKQLFTKTATVSLIYERNNLSCSVTEETFYHFFIALEHATFFPSYTKGCCNHIRLLLF